MIALVLAGAYGVRVAGRTDPIRKERPQVTARLASTRKRDQLNAIARARDERDLLGWGANVVIREAIDRYIARHRDLLPPELRD